MQNPFVAGHNLIQALYRLSQPVPGSEDGILFHQGDAPDGLFLLRSGEATLVMKSDSGRVVMSLKVDAGSVLGLTGVIADEPYTLTAHVSQGSEVRFVTRKDFEVLTQSEPSLYLEVLHMLAAQVRFARYTLTEM
jgi:CRP-like cAMP-binding protein